VQSQNITSRDNALLQRFRAVRDGRDKSLIFVEGLRLCEEALASRLNIGAIIYSYEIAEKERAKRFLLQVEPNSPRLASVSEKLLATVSYTKTPQGIVLLAMRPETKIDIDSSHPTPLLVVMHRINNPVNVGAIMRTAEAAGATGVIATKDTSDPYSPKSLRGAMGSAFRLPLWYGPSYEQVIHWCRERKIRTIAADVEAETNYIDVNWQQSCALILGPESDGLSDVELKATDQTVKVPMKGSVESLNVGVTAGIVLYEAERQRS